MSKGRNATLKRQDRTEPETRETTGNERAKFLAKEEFSRKSLSYAATCVAVIFFGLVVLPVFSSAVIPVSESARSEGFIMDILFLMVISLLSINFISNSYTFVYRNPFHNWLLFQRSLPVSPKEVVLARSLVMLPATVVMTALFFTPLTILARVLDYKFDAGQYLWFVVLWLGYALFSGGINLYMELGLNGKVIFALQFLWLGTLVAVAWLLGGDLVFTTFELAGSYGPLAAGVSLLAGGLLFFLLAKVAEHRVGKREMSP